MFCNLVQNSCRNPSCLLHFHWYPHLMTLFWKITGFNMTWVVLSETGSGSIFSSTTYVLESSPFLSLKSWDVCLMPCFSHGTCLPQRPLPVGCSLVFRFPLPSRCSLSPSDISIHLEQLDDLSYPECPTPDCFLFALFVLSFAIQRLFSLAKKPVENGKDIVPLFGVS